MNKFYYFIISLMLFISACNNNSHDNSESESHSKQSLNEYYDQSDRDDILSGGVKMIPIKTPAGDFKIWTKRVGNNPSIKVLLLHGGPGATHEYFECFDSFFPEQGFEYYYYDQLDSEYSDQPNDSSLWNIERFVEEVEQVRLALGLNKTNFYLLGQSWGGMLAIEYALKYQDNIKGLIISNMMSSIPDYIEYTETVLGPQLHPEVLAEITSLERANDFSNPRYMELISTNYYPEHVLRMPLESWPEPVIRSFNNTNTALYVYMQGPSEFGVAGNPKLKSWSRNEDLKQIKVPTLTMGGTFDTMDPEHMKWMSTQVKKGRYSHCPKGSHLSMYDDQEIYFKDLISFIKDVDEGNFNN